MSKPAKLYRYEIGEDGKRRKVWTGSYRIRWVDQDGKRHSAALPSFDDAREALRERERSTSRVRAGLEKPADARTLAEVFPAWLERRSVSRRGDDESRWRVHVEPFLGSRRIGAIDTAALEDLARHLQAKRAARPGQDPETAKLLAPMTVKNCLNLVTKVLADHGFRVHVVHKVPTQDYAWIEDASDVARFLIACLPRPTKDKPADPEARWFHVACSLAVYGGLRMGEVAGLRRKDVQFDRGMIRVERSYNGPTKSKQMRWAPLGPELAAILRDWLIGHAGERVIPVRLDDAGKPTDTSVIGERTGDLAKRVRKACAAAGVTVVTFHQLRHTQASHLVSRAGLSIPEVGAVLGHSDPRTTMRYAHLDARSLARDPRLHLSYTATDGKVLPFPAASDGQPVANRSRR